MKKKNNYGEETKSIGDCGEDCSSRTHSIPHGPRNDQLHETPVTVIGKKRRVFSYNTRARAIAQALSVSPLSYFFLFVLLILVKHCWAKEHT